MVKEEEMAGKGKKLRKLDKPGSRLGPAKSNDSLCGALAESSRINLSIP